MEYRNCKVCLEEQPSFNLQSGICSMCWGRLNVIPNDFPTLLRLFAAQLELKERNL